MLYLYWTKVSWEKSVIFLKCISNVFRSWRYSYLHDPNWNECCQLEDRSINNKTVAPEGKPFRGRGIFNAPFIDNWMQFCRRLSVLVPDWVLHIVKQGIVWGGRSGENGECGSQAQCQESPGYCASVHCRAATTRALSIYSDDSIVEFTVAAFWQSHSTGSYWWCLQASASPRRTSSIT